MPIKIPLKLEATVTSFSIVELMVTIAVIGILASAAFVFLNPVTSIKRSRDAVRFHNLNTLKSALILALQNGATFGNRCLAISPCDSQSGTTAVDGSGFVDLNLTGYLTQLPRDPLSASGNFTDASGQTVLARYLFAHDSSGNFEIRAYLESADNLHFYSDDGGDENNAYEVGTKLNIL